ncbi:MAG TPA: CocE/NonD family hydrolase [Thermoleophilaceae bacterium]|nr:CocE/NonD family hydrolase [Thermoleophilaceae bacterium]
MAAVVTLLVCGGSAHARDATVTSFDGTQIVTHFFPAAGLAPGAQAPTVLMGHGWGGSGATDPEGASDATTGNTGVGPLRNAGFNVLTWDARGFGGSGGQVEVDSPEHEGRDVQALIDWLALQPEARMEAPGDPLVGMSGVSYGGAIQLIAAAIDDRVDAITPTIAWHSLTRSLYRDGSVKQGWGTLLFAAGSASGNLNPQIQQAFTEGLSTGVFSDASLAFFDARGIDRLIAQIDVPTLISQGTVDTLFTLQEGIDNYAALKRNGVPLKMVWFCGGHGLCNSGAGPAGLVERSVIAWLRRHLKGEPVDTGPAFEWVADDGVLRSSADYPLAWRPPLRGTGSGLLPVTPGSPVTGGGQLIAASPALDAVNVQIEPASGPSELVGAPRVRITYSGTALPARTHLYAQVLDVRANRVLGNQVTPIPVILDGQQRTITRELEPVAAHATPESSYRVQIAAGTTVYGLQRSVGAVTLSRIDAELPVGMPVSSTAGTTGGGSSPTAATGPGQGGVDRAGDEAGSERVRLVVGKARGLATARRGERPVRVVVRARGGAVRRIRVVLRNRRGKAVAVSRRFGLQAGQRKVVRMGLRVDRLRAARYRVQAAGRAQGEVVRDRRALALKR